MRPPHRFGRRFGALALGAALVTGLAACGGGSGGDSNLTKATTASGRSTATVVPVTAGPVAVETLSGAPATLPASLQRAVLTGVRRYVDAATVEPLVDGKTDPHLEKMFLLTVSPRVTTSGADRGALTDDAVGKATGAVTGSAKPVRIAALGDGKGGWMMLGATIEYTVTAPTKAGRVTIHRFGDLYFSPLGKQWLISAYKIGVSRDTPSGTRRSGAQAGTTTTTKKVSG